jgi:hypothetical protein
MATSALACAGAMAAGQASAADMLSVGVHGYMEQWVGVADVNGNATKEGAFEVKSDSEIHFRGKLAADNGLTFTVDVQLEGNNSGENYIDESYLKITGDFGDLRIGSEDTASNLMHYGHQDVGIGFTAGDTGNWLGFGTPNTYGAGRAYFGDSMKVTYFTPRESGVQLGVSYMPDDGTHQAKNNAADNNDMDAWSVGLNYKGAIGDSSVAFSAGHHAASTPMDDSTTTNFGLQVGMGAFGFNVAFAEDDAGDGSDADETVTVGAKYSDGPLSVSVGYAMLDRGNGSDMTSGMLSAGYVLAPGVSWKSSLFQAEDGDMEGTGFVTGVAVGF